MGKMSQDLHFTAQLRTGTSHASPLHCNKQSYVSDTHLEMSTELEISSVSHQGSFIPQKVFNSAWTEFEKHLLLDLANC